jgi:hypothetical protein
VSPGLIGRRVRGEVRAGEIVEGEAVAVSASESGCTLYVWIVDDEHQLRRIADEGRCKAVVLPREMETSLREPMFRQPRARPKPTAIPGPGRLREGG